MKKNPVPWYNRKPWLKRWYQRVAYTPFYSPLGASESLEAVEEHPDVTNYLIAVERRAAAGEIPKYWGRGVFSDTYVCQYPVPKTPIQEQHCRGQF